MHYAGNKAAYFNSPTANNISTPAESQSQSDTSFSQIQTIVRQNQQEILLDRCSEVLFERVFETQLIPGSGIVSPNIVVRIEVSKNLQISSELFPDTSTDAYNEHFSEAHDIGDTDQSQVQQIIH